MSSSSLENGETTYDTESFSTSYRQLVDGNSSTSLDRTSSTGSGSSGPATPVQTFDVDFGDSQAKPGTRYFQHLCKTFRLHILYSTWAKIRGHDVLEEEKVAFHSSRRLALMRGLIHWVPLAAAIVLIWFNIARYYIGGELSGEIGQDTQKLAALQFAAKLHELLMLTSIGTVMFAYIREQMAFGEGVTIGTLFAGQQFSSINNLWSMEFWSAVYDIQGRGRKRPKYYIVLLIALATILGVSVGPSGAVLMRPRLDWWPSGGTIFWLNVTRDTLYNSHIRAKDVPSSCSQYTGDMACPYGGFESLIEQHAIFWPQVRPMGMMPESIWMQSTHSLRELKAYQRTSWDSNSTIWKNHLTHVKVPFASIANAISETIPLWSYAAANSPRGKHFKFRRDVSFSVDDFQPYVEAFCTPNRLSSSIENEAFSVTFANTASGPLTEVKDDLFGVMKVYPEAMSMEPSVEDSFWLKNTLFNSSVGSIKWLDHTGHLNNTNSSLLAIVALPQKRGGDTVFFACNIKSFLQPSTSQGTRSDPMLIKSLDRQDIGNIDLLEDDKRTKLRQSIWPSAAWAAYTNPYLSSHDTDVFAHILDAAGLGKATSSVDWPIITPYAIESIISLMVANGLSRMPYKTVTAGQLKGQEDPENNWHGGAWADQLLPQQGLGFGGHAYEISSEDEAQATQFQMKARVHGYAYGSKGPTQFAAIAVLMLYCLLAVFHIINSLRSGLTSEAWDTAPELTVLAFNSERSDAMYNTGAGIQSIRTMEQRVVVRSRNECLELIAGNTSNGGDVVKPGCRYH